MQPPGRSSQKRGTEGPHLSFIFSHHGTIIQGHGTNINNRLQKFTFSFKSKEQQPTLLIKYLMGKGTYKSFKYSNVCAKKADRQQIGEQKTKKPPNPQLTEINEEPPKSLPLVLGHDHYAGDIVLLLAKLFLREEEIDSVCHSTANAGNSLHLLLPSTEPN